MPFNYPYELFSSYGDISQKNIDTYLVGPHGLYNLQINFCTKVANVAKRDLFWLPSTSIQEWPRGDFGVYATKRKSCPEGKHIN